MPLPKSHFSESKGVTQFSILLGCIDLDFGKQMGKQTLELKAQKLVCLFLSGGFVEFLD